MSPRRLGEKSRLWCYRFLALRDGERCRLCGAFPVTRNDGNVPLRLEIDHIDGDPWNWQVINLRLLCKKCNLAERNRASCAPSGDSARYVCVQKELSEEGSPSTRVIKEAVDYGRGTPEMQANFLFEVDFRAWLLAIIKERGFVLKADAIAAGAETVGCSPATSARYVAKLISSVGPLQERKDMLGGLMLEFKQESRQAALFSQESHQVQPHLHPEASPSVQLL
jgi:hypothetical protein